jgi:hypothetical protein
MQTMKFARWVFRVAGIYGIVVLAPMYFLENRIGQETPPAITHAEFFYGFVGLGLAWQVAFLVISRDPERYRLIMLPSILEKFSFGIAVIVLDQQRGLPGAVLISGALDLIMGAFFVAAFQRTGRASSPAPTK